jgi:hypothetical protein
MSWEDPFRIPGGGLFISASSQYPDHAENTKDLRASWKKESMTEPKPSEPSVTITMSREEARAVLHTIREMAYFHDNSEAVDAIQTAIAAEPGSSADSLDAVLAECARMNLNVSVWPERNGGTFATVCTRTWPLSNPMSYRGYGDTPLLAIRAAMQAAADQGQGESSAQGDG